MATTHATVTTQRLASATVAAMALVLGALLDLAHLAAYLSGADIPVGIVALKIVFALAAIAAAIGLWRSQSWAVLLALAVAVSNVLLNGWGFADALMDGSTSTPEKAVTALGLLISLVIIALVTPLLRRHAVA